VTIWERVDTGRYATELHGHILQALRRGGPFDTTERPYVAVVDRVPLGIGAWTLSQAKTQAIQHVERQAGKAKAERLFKPTNGTAPIIPPEEIPPQPEKIIEFEPEPLPPEEPSQLEAIATHLAIPGQLAITGSLAGTLQGDDLLNTLNALRSALELLREHAELECCVNLPPVLKL
jgi:hypothetical protein